MDRTVFDAGGLVRDTPESAAEPTADAVVARTYRHGAIPGRSLVRLVPESLVVGADAEAALAGFAPRPAAPVVARQRRRSLGFPHWTLVHDRAHAALVLQEVPAFRAIARTAASKPGHARDAFVALARTFERKAPAVLPTFYEQVARVFVDAGSPKLAATFFDKARAAEATFGLVPDPERLSSVFLEFALAGAVTVKAIQAWTKDLAASGGAAAAYDRFVALAVGRTNGGLPPWASFAKDLARMAQAAGLRPDAAREEFLRQVLGAPALDRALASFWEEHADAVVSLAEEAPSFRALLGSRFPLGTASRWDGVDAAFAGAWLGLVHRAGALAPAWSPGFPGRAAWLAKLVAWAPDGLDALLPIVRAVGARLAAERQPVVLHSDSWVPAEVVDVLLELGVDVSWGEDDDWSLSGWAAGTPAPPVFGLPGEHRPRPLLALAARPDQRDRLLRQVQRILADDAFAAAAAQSPPIARMRIDALSRLLGELSAGGLPAAEEALETLSEVPIDGVRSEPELAAALADVDLARALACSLRAGVLEELGWPAWDEALAELGTEGLQVSGPFPYTVLAVTRRAIVLGPDGRRLAALDLKLPAGARLVQTRWFGNALLVGFRTADHDERAYWSTAPKDVFDVDLPWGGSGTTALPLPDGSSFTGKGVVRVGDRGWPEEEDFLTDGERAWRVDDHGFVGLDPATGRTLPGAPPPSFFAEVAPDDRWLCQLAALSSGPVGLRPGASGGIEQLDGHTWPTVVDRVLAWPGDAAPRALDADWRGLGLFGPDGAPCDHVDEEDPAFPEAHRWHWMVPRDPAGSAWLRTIDAARARALMADPTACPEVSDARLRAGIERRVEAARGLEERLRAWSEGTPDTDDVPLSPDAVTPEALYALLGVLSPGRSYHEDVDVLEVMRREAAFLAGAAESAPARSFPWALHFPHLRAMGWVLARPGLDDDGRRQLRAFLEGVLALPALTVRRAAWTFPDLSSPFLETVVEDRERHLVEAWTVREGGRWVARTDDTWSDEGPFDVETLSVGEGNPPGATVSWEETLSTPSAADRAWLRRLLEADVARTTLDPADVVAVSAGTGLSPAAAALLSAASPGHDRWEDTFLDAPQRAALGLQQKSAVSGRAELMRLERDGLRQVLEAAAPDDPAAFAHPPVQRLVDAFVARFGRRLPVSDALRQAASKQLGEDAFLDLVSAPDAAAVLTTDAVYGLSPDGALEVKGDGLDVAFLTMVVTGVPWLLHAVPVGDPLVANVPRVVERVRARLAAPGVWMEAGSCWGPSAKKVKAWFDAVGGTLDGAWRSLPGLRVALDDEQVTAFVAPAAFGPEAATALSALAAQFDDEELRLALRALESVGGLAACAERVTTTPVPDGAWETDPRQSVPALVAEVAATQKVSPEAAALWLQTLALPNPTKKDVCTWNGWTTRVYDAAAQALVAAKLLVEAKRARAGRAHFLPGPWVEADPAPYERWKVALLGGSERRGEITLPFGDVRVLRPPHALFEAAWARIRAGDRPRFG